MRRRRAALLLAALALVAGGCRGGEAVGRAAGPTAGTGEQAAEALGDAGVAADAAKLVVTPRGIVLPVQAREGDRWRVTTPCSATAVVEGRAVGPVDVVLDPGHGGEEPGAVGPNGLREKDLNLVVAARAAEVLQREGVRVVLTRRGDYRTTLATRGEIARAGMAKAFVSIHFNSGATSPSPTPGTEVYHQAASADARRLGGNVYESVYGVLRGVRGQAWVAAERPGVQVRLGESGGDLYGVLRAAGPVPAVLLEAAFLSHPPEAALLARQDAQRAIGEAVARGIIAHLRTDAPGTGFVAAGTQPVEAGDGGTAKGCEDPRF